MSAHQNRHRTSEIVSLAHLEHLLGWSRKKLLKLSREAGSHYDPFDRRREAGRGKWRHIDNPIGELREAQRAIQARILGSVALRDHMLGGVKGRSIRNNGAIHTRSATVVTLDLKNCFPSISDQQVYDVFHDHLGCRGEIPGLLTRLTTYHHRLPQGAPTSTTLANLSLLPLYDQIHEIAVARDLSLSFWVDDIAISGDRAEDALDEVIGVVQAHGLQISTKKLKLMTLNSAAQKVTGITTNRGVSAGRARIQSVYHEMVDLADQQQIPDYKIRRIHGLIQHIDQVKPGQGRRLRRLAERLLPERGSEGKRPRTDETRPCRNAKRHSEYRGAA